MSRGLPLEGLSILVVEDEPFIALDISDALQAAGARVVGPVNSLADAHGFARSEPLDAAILDVQIGHEDISVVPDTLAERSIPFLFYSGFGGGHALRQRWTDAIWLNKPCRGEDVVAAMRALILANDKKPRID